MEERNIELDDDGKIRIRTGRGPAEDDEPLREGEIVIETAAEEAPREDGDLYSEQEFLRRRAAREQEAQARRERARELSERGERLLSEQKFDEAGLCFLDAAEQNAADWRAWFGVVRAHTRGMTDFSQIYDCEQAYDKALRRMSAQDRAQIAAQYAPSLEAQAGELEAESAALAEQDARERAAAEPACKQFARRSGIRLAVFGALFVLFAVAAAALWPFIHAVAGAGILISAIVCTAFAAAMFFPAAVFVKYYAFARSALAKTRRSGTTPSGVRGAELAARAEIIRSIVRDFAP